MAKQAERSQSVAEQYARQVLGFPQRALLLPKDRIYEPIAGDVVLPRNLVYAQFLLYGLADNECKPPLENLDAVYAAPCVLAIGAARSVLWRKLPTGWQEEPLVAKEFRYHSDTGAVAEAGAGPGADLGFISSELCRRGCADQDYIAMQLRQALACLTRRMSADHAFWLLIRILHGLALLRPPASHWQKAGALLAQALERSCAAMPIHARESEWTVGLPDSTETITELTACLAPVRLSAIAYDMWGPLYETVVAAGERRSRGAYMTPPQLVDLVLWLATGGDTAGAPLIPAGLLLDPAAGTGAFPVRLLALVRQQADASAQLHSLASRLCALEASDLGALALRLNMAFQIALATTEELLPVVEQGDALETYSDFSGAQRRPLSTDAGVVADAASFVAAHSDFELVVGNPPYIGESGHKALFRRYREHGFWSAYCEGKMDFLQLFLTLGLTKIHDKEGGCLCFLTSAYWLSADGAGKLRELILSETCIHTVVSFRGSALFPGAPGHHSLIILLERRSDSQWRAAWRPRLVEVAVAAGEPLTPRVAAALAGEQQPGVRVWTSPQTQVDLVGHPWHFTAADADIAALAALNGPPLGSLYVTKQGVAPGAQRVDKAALAFLGADWVERRQVHLGEGIFVLTAAELAALHLSADEAAYVRPFVKNSSIHRYAVAPHEPLWLIYLRHDQDNAHCSRLLEHLSRFRPLLERKRELAAGRRQWYHLHWPREESMFTAEKVMTAQRGAYPAFAWCVEPMYAATDVYYILSKADGAVYSPTLPALTGILNSEVAAYWFAQRAKVKGEQREFFSGVLTKFPLPRIDGTDMQLRELRRLERCVRRLHAAAQHEHGATLQKRRQGGVEESVYRLYGLPVAVEEHIRMWAKCKKGRGA